MSASSDPSSGPDAAGQQTSAGPVEAQDSMSDLKQHLREAIAEPTDLIKEGTAPPPYFFAFEPSGGDQDQDQKFAALLGASALARIFAAMTLVRSRPEHSGGDGKGDETSTTRHYSLNNPSEYVAAFNEKTTTTVSAFTDSPLKSMYEGQQPEGATSKLELETTRADLHAKVLPLIFGGLAHAGKTHLAELDKVLTGFTAALKPFKVPTTSRGQGDKGGDDRHDGSQPQSELQHAVVVNYVKSIDITGGTGGPGGIYIHKAYTRIVIFSVTPQHWASALQKPAPKPAPKPHGSTYSSASHEEAAPGAAGHHHAADAAAAAAGTPEATGLSDWFGLKPKPKPKPDERIKFTLKTTVIELELSDAKYHANKAKFERILKGMAEGDEVLGPIAESGLDALGRRTCTIYQAAEA